MLIYYNKQLKLCAFVYEREKKINIIILWQAPDNGRNAVECCATHATLFICSMDKKKKKENNKIIFGLAYLYIILKLRYYYCYCKPIEKFTFPPSENRFPQLHNPNDIYITVLLLLPYIITLTVRFQTFEILSLPRPLVACILIIIITIIQTTRCIINV